jgi:hypothetical protein
MVFFELRWNYSPLKEKAVLLPDGLFICFCRYAALRSTPLYIQSSLCAFLLLMQAARRASRPRGMGVVDKICHSAAFSSTPLQVLHLPLRNFCC